MSDNENRINYYLGSLVKLETIPEQDKQKLVHLSHYNNTIKVWKDIYVSKLYELLVNVYGEEEAKHKKLLLKLGDVVDHDDQLKYSFTKNRTESFPFDGVILKNLNHNRHWGNFYNPPRDPIPFQSKKNILIWRGVTTSHFQYTANRFLLIEKWYNKSPCIDIGFTGICQAVGNRGEFFQKNNIRNYCKMRMSLTEMLRYKYILSCRGNDKDSGLNWKLASKSVVFMAAPRINTWLMESELIPDYHYVLLKDDFSDLLEKIQWANKNQDLVKKISENASIFMNRFSNKENEKHIEKEVIRRYFTIL